MAKGGTPAIQAVQRAGIAFRVHEYAHDPVVTSYGLEAAEALGVPQERVFKTLITLVDGTFFAVAILPVAARLSLKALAAAVGGKRAEMAAPAEAERITGSIVGGISPLGQRKVLPSMLDQTAINHQTIFVSAGRRGMDIELAPHDLLRLTRGGTAVLTQGRAED